MAAQQADPIERRGDDPGVGELGVRAIGVVKGRVDGRIREGGEHREDDTLSSPALSEVVVGNGNGRAVG